jgi:outer membrane lipoprotein SlyB
MATIRRDSTGSGAAVGAIVGAAVGAAVGAIVGGAVGAIVAGAVGAAVGAAVAAGASSSPPHAIMKTVSRTAKVSNPTGNHLEVRFSSLIHISSFLLFGVCFKART